MLCTEIVMNVKTKTKKQQFVYSTCTKLVVFLYQTCKSINDLSSYCGLFDARLRASEKNLPICMYHDTIFKALWDLLLSNE